MSKSQPLADLESICQQLEIAITEVAEIASSLDSLEHEKLAGEAKRLEAELGMLCARISTQLASAPKEQGRAAPKPSKRSVSTSSCPSEAKD
jgi:hypothetical protein